MIWLIGQQHGNEPAGGEAMLALAAALSSGELASLLDRLSIVIVPRGNPDGAADDQRVLASGVDLNRDHLLLSQPETRALHQVMRLLPPDVVIDHHEFSVAGRWAEKFGALHAVDVMILEATHPGVPKSLTEIAGRLYRPALEAAMDRHGLSSHDYVTTGADMDDRLVSLGGNAPGIARNAFGLRGSVSYLIETRGVGIGLQSYPAPRGHALPPGQVAARSVGGRRGKSARRRRGRPPRRRRRSQPAGRFAQACAPAARDAADGSAKRRGQAHVRDPGRQPHAHGDRAPRAPARLSRAEGRRGGRRTPGAERSAGLRGRGGMPDRRRGV